MAISYTTIIADRSVYTNWLWNCIEQGLIGQFEVLSIADALGYRHTGEPLRCCESMDGTNSQYFTSIDNLALLMLAAEGEL